MKILHAFQMKKSFAIASLSLLVFLGSTAWDAPQPEPNVAAVMAVPQDAVPVVHRASQLPTSSMKGTFLLAD